MTHLYPRKLKDLDNMEAMFDGFNFVLDMQKAICKLNNIKSLNHWSFITRFKAIPNIDDYLGEKKND